MVAKNFFKLKKIVKNTEKFESRMTSYIYYYMYRWKDLRFFFPKPLINQEVKIYLGHKLTSEESNRKPRF